MAMQPACSHSAVRTVLVVEDSPIILRLATRILSAAGWHVMGAPDGAKALDILRARHGDLDVVVLDLQLPEIDGEELLEETRRLVPELPVLVTTGWADAGTVARLSSMGPCSFLQKPYRAPELIEAVNLAHAC